MMRSCFRELGLSEHATKAQVEEAYARRVARYKGPDYAEEPEYVHKKLVALKAAYEEARQIARIGDDSTYSPVVRADEGRNTTKTVKKLAKPLDDDYGDDEHTVSEKLHRWLEKRDDDKTRKSNKTAKKDRKKKKGGMVEDLKNIDAQKLKSAWEEFKSDALGLASTPLVPEEDETIDDDDYVFNDSGQRLGDGGTIVSEPKKEKSKGSEIISIVATLLIAGITLFGSCGDDGVTFEDDEYIDSGYDYLFHYEEIADTDTEINSLASDSEFVLNESGSYSSALFTHEEEEAYRDEADQFAKYYWGMESIEDVTDYLFGAYAEYPISSAEPLDKQLDHIFAFYGFMLVEDAILYDHPYTNKQIESYADYLSYLNQYYEENVE